MCVFFFSVDRKNKRPAWPLIGWDTISSFSLRALSRIWRNLTERKNLTTSTKFVFFRPIEKNQKDDLPSLRKAETFSTFLKPLTEFAKTWQEARTERPLPSFFSGRSAKHYVRPSIWFAEAFLILLWNHWPEFDESW